MDPLTLFGTDVVLFVVIGLLAGAHCIGMCGPLVTLYSSRMGGTATDGGTAPSTGAASGRRSHFTVHEVTQHALFNLGRAASYTVLGAAFGALGAAVVLTTDQLTPIVDAVRGGIGIVIGGFVVATGVYYLLGRTTGGVHLPGLERLTGWLTGYVDRLASGPGIVGLAYSTACCRVRSSTRRTSTRSPSDRRPAGRSRSRPSASGRFPRSSPTGRSSRPSTSFTAAGCTACSVSHSSSWGTSFWHTG